MAQINDTLDDFEVQSVTRLIDAELALREARVALNEAKDELESRASHLTKIMFDEVGGVPISNLPEQFVIEYHGDHWLVTLDVDANNRHKLTFLGGYIAEVSR